MLLEEALRGAAWPGNAATPYPRSDPADDHLPGDTWGTAQIPVGVRLELIGDATGIEIDYTCATDDPGDAGPIELVRGLPLLGGDQLPDGVHPGDEGPAIMADAIGGAVARAATPVTGGIAR